MSYDNVQFNLILPDIIGTMPINAYKPGSQDVFLRPDYASVRQDKQPPRRFGRASSQHATAGDLAVGERGGRATAKGYTDEYNPATAKDFADEHKIPTPQAVSQDPLRPAPPAPAAQNNTATPESLDGPVHHGSETRQTSQVTGRVAPQIKAKLLELGKVNGWTESKLVGEAVAAYVEQDLGEKFGVKLAGKVTDAIDRGLAKHGNRQAYYAAEESRILNAKVLRYLFGEDTQMYQQTLKQARIEAYQNLKHKVEEKQEIKA